MDNKKILEDLIKEYERVSINNSCNIVIDDRWQNEDYLKDINKGIDLIIVGDNPGKHEESDGVYFSTNGSAGKQANTFIEFVKHFYKKKLRYLYLNKTPYHTNSSASLKIDDSQELLMQKTVDALSHFSYINNELIILIVGYSKIDLNKCFYEILNNKMSSICTLRNKLFFANHFSYGNFFEPFVRHITKSSTDSKTIDFIGALKSLQDDVLPRLENYHKFKI